MGIMSKFTVTPLLYTVGILLVVIGGLGVKMKLDSSAHKVVVSGYSSALAKMTANRDQYRSLAAQRGERIKEVNGANKTNMDTIATLSEKLKEAVGQEQQTAQALAAAVAQRNAARNARDKALDNLRKSRETTYATDPTCAEWGARPVCAAISDSLQQQWDKARQLPADQDANGRGSSAPAGADRGDADGRGRDAPAPGPDASGAVRPDLPAPGGMLFQFPGGRHAEFGAGRLRQAG